MNFLNKRKKGFTLIEVMVVMSIISLLASIVFGFLGEGKVKAASQKTMSEAKQLAIAAELGHSGSGVPVQGTNYFIDNVPEVVSNMSTLPEISSTISKISNYYYISNGEESVDATGIYYDCLMMSEIYNPIPAGGGTKSSGIITWIDHTFFWNSTTKRKFLVLSPWVSNSALPGSFYEQISTDLKSVYGNDVVTYVGYFGPGAYPRALAWWDPKDGGYRFIPCDRL